MEEEEEEGEVEPPTEGVWSEEEGFSEEVEEVCTDTNPDTASPAPHTQHTHNVVMLTSSSLDHPP